MDDDFKDEVMLQLMDMETKLINSPLDIETRCTQYWGALILVCNIKLIDWESVLRLFGEFTSKVMKLR